MSLPDIDTLMKMSSDELDQLLESEVQAILDNQTTPEQRQKLERLHWVLRSKVKTGKLNYINIYTQMMDSLHALKAELERI